MQIDKTQDATDELVVHDAPSATGRTRTSTAWFLVVSFIIGLTLLLIFILQNLQYTSIQFFNLHWKIPLGIAMLLALVVGGLLVAIFGIARVMQLGSRLHHQKLNSKA